ncbi:RDD family protein [Streptomyces decoyicus]|uniref:RDD family protein n=1 Tax=Streptomyces decoyicus TaxID=249567 RepID=UPI00069CE17C|nr:RDD family protein [Streptomyces decoyicus]KOG40610.1 RDD domain-containing protein [Streptomyces decoyicus]QZY16206.1 RDD family protein [Streptomyces decoyicus]
MSTDQPPGEPPENDPFLKKPQEPPAGGAPRNSSPRENGAPRNHAPRGNGAGAGGTGAGEGGTPPPGGPPPGGTPPPYAGDPYGSGPYAGDPYGGQPGPADPLAGMPPLANRGRRLVARIIDAIIIGVPVSVIMTLIVGGVDYFSTDSVEAGRQSTVSGVTMLAYLIYDGLMISSRGQTLGKMAMKIRVAMLSNGSTPTAQASWIRAAVYTLPEIVPCCGFIFWLVNVLWCTWDQPYHQCLHDKAAKTVVVSTETGGARSA